MTSTTVQRLGADNRINAYGTQADYKTWSAAATTGATPVRFLLLEPPSLQMQGTIEQQTLFGANALTSGEPNRAQETGVRRVEGQFIAPLDIVAAKIWFTHLLGAPTELEASPVFTRTWNGGGTAVRLLTIVSQIDSASFTAFRSVTINKVTIPIAPDRGAAVQRLEFDAMAAEQSWGNADFANVYLASVSTPANVSYSPVTHGSVSVTRNAVSFGNIIGGSIEISNGVEHVPIANNSGFTMGGAYRGLTTASARLRLRIVDDTFYAAAGALPVVFTWASGTNTFKITLNNAAITPVGPRAEGAGGVEQEFVFNPVQDDTLPAVSVELVNGDDPTPPTP